MRDWMIGVYAVVLLTLIAAAGFVGLFGKDDLRGERALKILKIVLAALAGAGGLLAAVMAGGR
ncbi:hypothetical protein [Amycolatopsis nigrescens]|uniref:hypothetical protein n=1 Tax=Amycolatopsis nigrescens TaxID=381445 RepID=UPI0003759270|nr:hypothetical protein [Amycolatopsis nigrescens]